MTPRMENKRSVPWESWDGVCQRCGKESAVHIMSMFNVQLICISCSDVEREHPKFEEARKAEHDATKSGDRNFEGIGLPEGLKSGT